MSFAQIMLLHFDELFESESNNLTSFMKYLPHITFTYEDFEKLPRINLPKF